MNVFAYLVQGTIPWQAIFVLLKSVLGWSMELLKVKWGASENLGLTSIVERLLPWLWMQAVCVSEWGEECVRSHVAFGTLKECFIPAFGRRRVVSGDERPVRGGYSRFVSRTGIVICRLQRRYLVSAKDEHAYPTVLTGFPEVSL